VTNAVAGMREMGGHESSCGLVVERGLRVDGGGDGVSVDAAVELEPISMGTKGGERGRLRSDGWGFQQRAMWNAWTYPPWAIATGPAGAAWSCGGRARVSARKKADRGAGGLLAAARAVRKRRLFDYAARASGRVAEARPRTFT
jgi:hypothetical protein